MRPFAKFLWTLVIIVYRIVRNKAADMARMSNRGGQHCELGLMLPSSSTTRQSGQGVSLTDDEAAAQLYAIGKSLLQGGAGALSPIAAQQTAAGGSGSGPGGGGLVFNAATPIVDRRAAASDDGECEKYTAWDVRGVHAELTGLRYLLFDVALRRENSRIDWVKVLRPTRHIIDRFRDVFSSHCLGLVLKKLNPTQQKQETQE